MKFEWKLYVNCLKWKRRTHNEIYLFITKHFSEKLFFVENCTECSFAIYTRIYW